QWTVPGQPTVPLWYCQLSASQLASAVGLSSCVSASFTGTGSGLTLTATSVTGKIQPGMTLAGTGVPASTTGGAQLSATAGGAGAYVTSQASRSASNALTAGGIPPNATMAALQSETANVRWRDDGAPPTSSVGMILVSAVDPVPYNGTLSALQFIAATGSPL